MRDVCMCLLYAAFLLSFYLLFALFIVSLFLLLCFFLLSFFLLCLFLCVGRACALVVIAIMAAFGWGAEDLATDPGLALIAPPKPPVPPPPPKPPRKPKPPAEASRKCIFLKISEIPYKSQYFTGRTALPIKSQSAPLPAI